MEKNPSLRMVFEWQHAEVKFAPDLFGISPWFPRHEPEAKDR